MSESSGRKPETHTRELLLHWIRERESIREKKEAGLPKPWSEDPVFQSTYFCNVHREDDKTTRFIRNKYFGYGTHPFLIYNYILARFINRAESLQHIPFIWEHDSAELELMLERVASIEGQLWSGAYIITTHGLPMGKVAYLVNHVLQGTSQALGRTEFMGPLQGPTLRLRPATGLTMRLCVYCLSSEDVGRDHVPPKNYGSDQTVDCCRFCNSMLGERDLVTLVERAAYLEQTYAAINPQDRKYSEASKRLTNVQKQVPFLRGMAPAHFLNKRLVFENYPTCAAYHGALMRLEGLGSFLAAQVVADLKNTHDHPLQNAPDRYSFVAHGPGSLRGCSWFHYGRIGMTTPSSFPMQFQIIRDYLTANLDWEIDNQDLQNCLCEFDKYMRVKTGIGKSKRKYNGIDNRA